MAHPIPKELKGEERFFTIPFLNIHLGKKGIAYCGIATVITVLLTNFTQSVVIKVVTLLLLNAIAFPLAEMKMPAKKFDGGGVPFDTYFKRYLRYTLRGKNLYIRKIGKKKGERKK